MPLCWSCCRFSTSSGVRLLLHGCVRNWYSSESQRDSPFCCRLYKIVQRLVLGGSFFSFGQQLLPVLNRRCCVGRSMHAYAGPDLAAVRSMIPQRTNLSMPLFSSIARLSSFPAVLSTSVPQIGLYGYNKIARVTADYMNRPIKLGLYFITFYMAELLITNTEQQKTWNVSSKLPWLK